MAARLPSEATDAQLVRLAAEMEGRCIWVTLVGIDGSASRSLGAQMLVADDGTYHGQLTGGCFEGAIAAEAVEARRAGACRTVRFGKGSRFFDLKLPCGGGIDVHFDVAPGVEVMRDAARRVARREGFAFRFDPGGAEARRAVVGLGDSGGSFRRSVLPSVRLVVAGQGAELMALVRLGLAAGYEVAAVAPRPAAAEACAGLGAEVLRGPPTALDGRCAVVSLLHDLDAEEGVLVSALPSAAFYVGAIGGAKTRAARLERLAPLVPSDALSRLRAPAGLVPSSRDPGALAVSILAEVSRDAALSEMSSTVVSPVPAA